MQDQAPVPRLAAGVRGALESARRLAVAAAAAADTGHSHAAAVLLYQAAEEVGKAKLLKNHLDTNTSVSTDPKSDFRKHAEKFRLAVQVVPADCLELWGPAFDPKVFQANVFQTQPVLVDFQRRNDSLYLNWNEGAGDWAAPATPDRLVVKASADRMVVFVDTALTQGLP